MSEMYDSNYDLDRDGRLNCGEQVLYQKYVLGEDFSSGGGGSSLGSYGGGRSSYSRNSVPQRRGSVIGGLFCFILMMALFVIGLGIAILCPPVGILFILGAIKIKEDVF